MTYYVYIIFAGQFDKFYIGQTSDLNNRLLLHNSRKVPSTAPFVPWELVGVIKKQSRAEAMALEKKLKNLNRQRLKIFIEKYLK